jgi:DNA invertase Pin-like site-specific DNA recombinase
MRVAVYARVSTPRQAQAQSIEQQLDRLRAAVAEHGWTLADQHVYRDDGYSGASLGRPGLDRLRDHAALAELDVVLVTAPDRLARNYVHQVLLLDELGRHGCQVEFLDHPMSQDPHDQLLLQIRGAVAEYERTLIAERMRRGRQAGCGRVRCCRGPARRLATAWTPSGPARRPGCGWSPARRCWSRSCSTGICNRGRPCTSSPSD